MVCTTPYETESYRTVRDYQRQELAEREGFEPSIRFWRILTFQASAFDHSATAPHAFQRGAP